MHVSARYDGAIRRSPIQVLLDGLLNLATTTRMHLVQTDRERKSRRNRLTQDHPRFTPSHPSLLKFTQVHLSSTSLTPDHPGLPQLIQVHPSSLGFTSAHSGLVYPSSTRFTTVHSGSPQFNQFNSGSPRFTPAHPGSSKFNQVYLSSLRFTPVEVV